MASLWVRVSIIDCEKCKMVLSKEFSVSVIPRAGEKLYLSGGCEDSAGLEVDEIKHWIDCDVVVAECSMDARCDSFLLDDDAEKVFDSLPMSEDEEVEQIESISEEASFMLWEKRYRWEYIRNQLLALGFKDAKGYFWGCQD